MLKRAESRTHKNHFWQKKSSPSHLGSFEVDAQPPHMIASSHQNESSLNVFLAISVPTRIVIICMRWCVNDTSPVVTFLSSLKKDSTSLLGTFLWTYFPKCCTHSSYDAPTNCDNWPNPFHPPPPL